MQHPEKQPPRHSRPSHAQRSAVNPQGGTVRKPSAPQTTRYKVSPSAAGDPRRRPAARATIQRSASRRRRRRNAIRRRAILACSIAVIAIAIVLIIVLRPKAQAPVQPQETIAAATHTPQPTFTPEPTASPVPMPTMVTDFQLLSGIPNTDRAMGIPKSAIADDSFFNDTLFVGDSVSQKLKTYVTSERKRNPSLLGDAKFLTAPSFSARNALKEVTETSLHPSYQGKKMRLEDIVAEVGCRKVYIMLGLNDVGIYGPERSAENMMELIREIKAKSPDVQIFVQSATPRLRGDEPTTEELFAYNLKLYELCLQMVDQDIYFLDVAYIFRDENGKLFEHYCSDADSMALHFNADACEKWVDFLYTHTLPV